MVEEFATSEPVAPFLPDDHFERIVRDFVAAGGGRQGQVGDAPSLLVEAAEICAFAVRWLEARSP